MILNAKSGICPEDCGYCGQSVKMKEKQRYALVDQEQIKAGHKSRQTIKLERIVL